MFEELLVRIARVLEQEGLPYMIIGGQAVLFYGTPRLTKDIDVTLGVDIDELDRLVKAVETMGLVIIPQDFPGFVRKTFVLPTKDSCSGIRVDFIFSYTPYERQAIERARAVVFSKGTAKFAALEDVIIHKIFAGRPRDLEDVRSIMTKNPQFDVEYTKNWLAEFDRSMESSHYVEILEELLRETK